MLRRVSCGVVGREQCCCQRVLAFIVPLALIGLTGCFSASAEEQAGGPEQQTAVADQIAVEDGNSQPKRPAPKPLSKHARNGLAYLIRQQNEDGGWGQGGGWRIGANGQGRIEGQDVEDPSDVGNTCIATLALLRSGSTPQKGPYARHIRQAIQFINRHVEQSDQKSLYVTPVRNTQLQSKIGPYVDTFLTALVLSEVKGKMPNEKEEGHLLLALDKTIRKIETNQKDDGTFANNGGWASVLSQGLCSKALNRACQNGVAVQALSLRRDYRNAAANLGLSKGELVASSEAAAPATVAASGTSPAPISSGVTRADRVAYGAAGLGGGTPRGLSGGGRVSGGTDAGVQIYGLSANLGRLSDLNLTNQTRESASRLVLQSQEASEKEKHAAQATLAEIAEVKKAQQTAMRGVVARLDDKRFIAGFGNNGGEEFLSYMNISETLCSQGGKEWNSWDKSITENLNRVQNDDGSWSGHHCITGRTFCTSASLLTLLADRMPIPESATDEVAESQTP